MQVFKQWGHTIAVTILLVIIFSLARFAVDASQPTPTIQSSQSDANQSSQRQEQNESLWRLWTWSPVTLFTLVLTVATSGLLVYTARLWEATVNSANETRRIGEAAIKASVVAANAAAKSADAAVSALNRPWLVPSIVIDNLREARDSRVNAKIGITFYNYGDTFAEVIGCWMDFEIWFDGWPISQQQWSDLASRGREDTGTYKARNIVGTIVQAKTLSGVIEEERAIGIFDFWDKIFRHQPFVMAGQSYKNILGAVGEIIYRDPYGNIHYTGFCYRQNFMGDAFVVDPNSTYRHRT